MDNDGIAWAAKLQTFGIERTGYKDLLGSRQVVASTLFKTDKKSYGIFLCGNSSGHYLLIDSRADLKRPNFKRYVARIIKNGDYQFNKVEFKIAEKETLIDDNYSVYLKVTYHKKDKGFSVATYWYREGKVTLEGTCYRLILVKSAPGYLFRLDHDTDNLIVDLNRDGVFDLAEEAKPIGAAFRVNSHLYQASAVDTFGRSITFSYVGVDTTIVFKAGDRFPSIALQDLNGETHTNIGHDGRITLLYFGATWCTPCAALVSDLRKVYQNFRNRRIEIIGISVDRSPRDLETYLHKEKLPWSLAFGENEVNRRVAKMFSVSYIPKLIVIDTAGFIRHIGPGLRGKKLEQLVGRLCDG